MQLTVRGVPSSVERALEQAFASFDGPDVCVVGAADGSVADILGIEPPAWAAQIARLTDACFTAQRVLSDALAAGRPARLIFLSNPPAVRAIAGKGLDAIAGAFLSTIAQIAAVEAGAHDITANVVVAGWLEDGDLPPTLVDAIPSGRFATPDDIAQVCLFLAAPGASYVNGATIAVDGATTVSKADSPNPFRAS